MMPGQSYSSGDMSWPPVLHLLQDCHHPPFTPESLGRLQATLGVRFPEDYAKFLFEFNGGSFYRRVTFTLPEL